MSADHGDATGESTAETGARETAPPVEAADEERATDDVLACGVDDSMESGFAWCETASTGAAVADATDTGPESTGDEAESTDGGFEWCDSTVDDSDTESVGSEAESPETSAATDAVDELVLPSDLVTTTRGAGIDDEAVALLTALRRDPASGRWRRAEAEFGHDE